MHQISQIIQQAPRFGKITVVLTKHQLNLLIEIHSNSEAIKSYIESKEIEGMQTNDTLQLTVRAEKFPTSMNGDLNSAVSPTFQIDASEDEALMQPVPHIRILAPSNSLPESYQASSRESGVSILAPLHPRIEISRHSDAGSSNKNSFLTPLEFKMKPLRRNSDSFPMSLSPAVISKLISNSEFDSLHENAILTLRYFNLTQVIKSKLR